MNLNRIATRTLGIAALTAALGVFCGSVGAGPARASILLPASPPACDADPATPCITVQPTSTPAGTIVVTGAVGATSDTMPSSAPQLELDVKDGDTTIYSSQAAQVYAQPSVHDESQPRRSFPFSFSVEQSAFSGANRYLTFSVTATTLSGARDSRGILLPLYTHHTSNVYRVYWINPTPRIGVECRWTVPLFSLVPDDDGWLVSATNLPPNTVVNLSLLDASNALLWGMEATTTSDGKFDHYEVDFPPNTIHIPADQFTNRDTGRYHVVASVPSAGTSFQTAVRGYFDVCSST